MLPIPFCFQALIVFTLCFHALCFHAVLTSSISRFPYRINLRFSASIKSLSSSSSSLLLPYRNIRFSPSRFPYLWKQPIQELFFLFKFLTARKHSLGQGPVFIRVCHLSTRGRGSMYVTLTLTQNQKSRWYASYWNAFLFNNTIWKKWQLLKS